MWDRTEGLSGRERTISAVFGAALTALAVRLPPGWRAISALAGGALLARGATGHCAVKSALSKKSARSARRLDRAIDDSLEGTFPASDPPASHLPDEPPINADAKWRAARAAGG